MSTDSDRQEVARKLARCLDLLREYPDGSISELIREYIAELKKQLRDENSN